MCGWCLWLHTYFTGKFSVNDCSCGHNFVPWVFTRKTVETCISPSHKYIINLTTCLNTEHEANKTEKTSSTNLVPRSFELHYSVLSTQFYMDEDKYITDLMQERKNLVTSKYC